MGSFTVEKYSVWTHHGKFLFRKSFPRRFFVFLNGRSSHDTTQENFKAQVQDSL